MSQEIKLMVRPGIGGKESSTRVEQELNALMSDSGGWKMRDVFHIGQEKDGSHNVMFVLVRDTGEPVKELVSEAIRRGRPPKTE